MRKRCEFGTDMMIELKPNTMRHKQLIKEHGSKWRVKWGPLPMQCFGNELGLGIESLDNKHFRNVRVEDVIRDFEK